MYTLEELSQNPVGPVTCPASFRPIYNTGSPANNDGSLRKIPKVLHVAWIRRGSSADQNMHSRCVHEYLASAVQSWRKALPGYSIVFHDDDAVDKLLGSEWLEFPFITEMMKCLAYGSAVRIDVWRVLLLYKYGGVYTDIDNTPGELFSEETIQSDDEAFFLSDGFGRPSQWFQAMEPGHPIAYLNMYEIFGRVLSIQDMDAIRVVMTTGPDTLRHAYGKFLNWQPSKEEIFSTVSGSRIFRGKFNKTVRKVENSAGSYVLGGGAFTAEKRKKFEQDTKSVHWQKEIFLRLKTARITNQVTVNKPRLNKACLDHLFASTTSAHSEMTRQTSDPSPTHGTMQQMAVQGVTDVTLSPSLHPAGSIPCCSKAWEQSYGLFDNVSDSIWKQLKEYTTVQNPSWYWNPQNPLEGIDDAKTWMTKNMNPNFNCPQLVNVAFAKNKKADGAYAVCNPLGLVNQFHKGVVAAPQPQQGEAPCLVYSIGCAGNFRFEDSLFEMHKGKCEIHVFDPGNWARRGDVEQKNIHYHAWGISSTYDRDSKSVVWPRGKGGGFKTMKQTIEELGHANRVIDLMQIDCEGCEWSSHRDWLGLGIRQILIEAHGVPSPNGTPKNKWYQKPKDVAQDYWGEFSRHGYALYHKHNNGLAMELAFVKLHEDFWK